MSGLDGAGNPIIYLQDASLSRKLIQNYTRLKLEASNSTKLFKTEINTTKCYWLLDGEDSTSLVISLNDK